jgi:hypothetical protein
MMIFLPWYSFIWLANDIEAIHKLAKLEKAAFLKNHNAIKYELLKLTWNITQAGY